MTRPLDVVAGLNGRSGDRRRRPLSSDAAPAAR